MALIVAQCITFTFKILTENVFTLDIRAGIAALSSADIHAVTGILKLYFRELPEPLFTESSYQNFVDTLSKFIEIVFF